MKKNSVVKVCVVYYGSVSIVFKFCWEWQPRQVHNGHVQRLDQHCAASEKKTISENSELPPSLNRIRFFNTCGGF